MYTAVPAQVRQDMQWMADIGTDSVCVGVLEQDLRASRYNLALIAAEAERCGIELWVVPSRWGGLVAGAPKVPSLFSVQNPETWILKEDGSPVITDFSGVISSVYHPATLAFYRKALEAMLDGSIPIKGLIWDEVKVLGMVDHSPAARAARPPAGGAEDDARATAAFFDQAGAYAKSLSPGLQIGMFLYCDRQGPCQEAMAGIEHLDDFGCDGRPWSAAMSSREESKTGKLLIDHAPWFIRQARDRRKNPLVLIENHHMTSREVGLMDKGLPEVLSLGAGHVLYYYYPRNLEDPEYNMQVVARLLKAWRKA